MLARALWVLLLLVGLTACAAPAAQPTRLGEAFPQRQQLDQLLPADALLLGEQHDVPEHQRLHLAVVQALARHQTLAALALEMADQGQSTQTLGPGATDDEVRSALQWQDASWPWAAYGPAIMAAVRAGVPVAGANLPAKRLREAMADTALDQLLPGPAFKAQQHAIRQGHCDLLPESQMIPMTRVQIARDVSMAQTLVALARPGQTVVLLSGNRHVDRALGVPRHLPRGFIAKTVLLQARHAQDAVKTATAFDQTWVSGLAPDTDYCAALRASRITPAPAESR